jgi:hypothetical protein
MKGRGPRVVIGSKGYPPGPLFTDKFKKIRRNIPMKKYDLILLAVILSILFIGCKLTEILGKKSDANNSVNIPSNSSRSANGSGANSPGSNSTGVPPDEARIYKIMEDKANELGKTQTTVRLDPAAKVKGRIAVVNKKYDFTPDFYIELFGPYMNQFTTDFDLGVWGIDQAHIATKPEEIDTLIRITCQRGKQIGKYTSPGGDQSVPAYAMTCGVDIIDYKTATVVAQKSFTNNVMPKSASISSTAKDYVVMQPSDAIKNYLKKFPRG